MIVSLLLLLAAGSGSEEGTVPKIVGSSTIAPYAELVSQRLGAGKTVHIEPTGSNAGFEALCSEDPVGRPSVAMASRQFSNAEVLACGSRIGHTIAEYEVGTNGVAVVTYRGGTFDDLNLSSTDLFLALAAEVPVSESDCTLVANPHTNWAEVHPTLPDQPIKVFGPGPDSGTRSVFDKGALYKGARAHPCAATLDAAMPGNVARIASNVRTDGVWIEVGEDDVELVSDLHNDLSAVGIIGYASASRFDRHVKLVKLDGSLPSAETIATGAYSLGSKLYLYVNEDQLAAEPSAGAFVESFTSDEAIGQNGYLVRRGLISAR